MNDLIPSGQSGEFLLHERQGDESKIDVRELREEATVAKVATVRQESVVAKYATTAADEKRVRRIAIA